MPLDDPTADVRTSRPIVEPWSIVEMSRAYAAYPHLENDRLPLRADLSAIDPPEMLGAFEDPEDNMGYSEQTEASMGGGKALKMITRTYRMKDGS